MERADALATQAFLRAGVGEAAAGETANALTLTEAMGISTHGLSRVRNYVQRIRAGGIDPQAKPEIQVPAPALRHIDGKNGLGPAIAESARAATQDAAAAFGIGAGFVRGANHLGALAPYLYRAAEAGFAAIMTTNTAPMIAAPGGKAALIGNNPVGIAIPHPDGQHVILDMALSMVSRSRLRAAAEAQQPVPDSWAMDADGNPTTDPSLAIHGLMRAIGGGKGAHLALCLDLLAGALSGAGMLDEIPAAADQPQSPQNLGQMFILIDAEKLLPKGERRRRLARARDIITGSGTDRAAPPRLPGARTLECLCKARREGLVVAPGLLRDLNALAGG